MRRSRSIIAALLLGVLTTILVAWGAAAWHGSKPRNPFERDSRGVYLQRGNDLWHSIHSRQWGRTVHRVRVAEGTRAQDIRWRQESMREFWDRTSGRELNETQRELLEEHEREPTESPPRWVRLPPDEQALATVAYGWPAPAVMYWTESPVYQRSRRSAALRLPTWKETSIFPGMSRSRTILLPVIPIPLGLAVNSLFFGAFWWCVIRGVKQAARALKRRRGRCTRCGYDVIGLDRCPECGDPAPSRRRLRSRHPRRTSPCSSPTSSKT